jgi:hypothetical protein
LISPSSLLKSPGREIKQIAKQPVGCCETSGFLTSIYQSLKWRSRQESTIVDLRGKEITANEQNIRNPIVALTAALPARAGGSAGHRQCDAAQKSLRPRGCDVNLHSWARCCVRPGARNDA